MIPLPVAASMGAAARTEKAVAQAGRAPTGKGGA